MTLDGQAESDFPMERRTGLFSHRGFRWRQFRQDNHSLVPLGDRYSSVPPKSVWLGASRAVGARGFSKRTKSVSGEHGRCVGRERMGGRTGWMG